MAAAPVCLYSGKPNTRNAGRNLGLDVARAGAVSTVLLSHLLLQMLDSNKAASFTLIYTGRAAVELFFSLSGFLIGGLLIDLAQRGPSAGRVAGFWFRRWMRTLPLYYFVLWFATKYFGQSEPHAWLFLQNFYPDEFKLVPVAWSLALEESFYLFFPILMLAAVRAVRGGIRLVASIALFLIVACTAARAADAYGLLHTGWTDVGENPLMRMDCAAYGVLACCLYRRCPSETTRLIRHRGCPALIICLMFAALWGAPFVWAMSNWERFVQRPDLVAVGRVWLILQDSTLELVFAAAVLILFVLSRNRLGASRLAWCVRQVSLLSYSSYLVHGMVILLIEHAGLAPGLPRLVTQLLMTLVVSACTYFAVERPFLALRDFLSWQRKPAAAPQTSGD